MDKLKFETPDMVSENIDKIAALFPSAITEMRDCLLYTSDAADE